MTTHRNDFLDNDHPDSLGVRPMRRSEGIAYLMKEGNLDTPCCVFGRTTADVAPVVWRAAYVWTGVACEELTTDTLDQFMRYALERPEEIQYLIRQYGHRMYR